MTNKGVYWFTNDLRVEDNATLLLASEKVDELLCIFVVEPLWFNANRYGQLSLGQQRWNFLQQTLLDLNRSLKPLGQSLVVIYDDPIRVFSKLISELGFNAVFRSQNTGFYENSQWEALKHQYANVQFFERATHTIFSETTLDLTQKDLPATFSQFRRRVEPLSVTDEPSKLISLPPPARHIPHNWEFQLRENESTDSPFLGGASEAHKHIKRYMNALLPSTYKDVRNALDGWENSTKLSPWLANGSLSVRQVLRAVNAYEQTVESNESTYWIRFELLWREYFQWYAHKHGATLFHFKGIKHKNPLTSFYPERFQRWCQGNTPYPLVNACMKQLNATGYMSNRGRQIVASCLVNELQLDWRYGAAYFEQQLVDYDVAVNWGNWQYLAGVGADPRGKRHFDIEKQTRLYDPEQRFINTWSNTPVDATLDSVDAADWPIHQP